MPRPSRMPALTAATNFCIGGASSFFSLTSFRQAMASASLTPVIAVVRVPPSACKTSQSTQIVRGPSFSRSITARSERPIKRWISTLRPSRRPFAASRGFRVCVEYGSIEYSAVSQPPVTPCSFIQRGTASSIVTPHITRVCPIETSTEPLACGATFNSKLSGRISSGPRPSLRCIKEKLNAGPSLRDEDFRRRKWRLLNHLVHPELRAASQQYGDVAYPIDSQLGSNAGGLFTLHSPTICRSSALLSAGVGVQWNQCGSTYVYYNWAATITPATTSTADCGPVSGKSVPQASLPIPVDKGNSSRNTKDQ